MYRLLSPAKINTFLNVIGKTKDGYHTIDSHLQLVSLFDEFLIKEAKNTIIKCNTNIAQDQNIIFRTMSWFEKRYKKRHKFQIKLTKNIPIGSGLGGGSSNAATMLNFLCHYNGISNKYLDYKDLAIEIGADVPFFVNSRSCYVGGIGEIILKEKSRNSNFLLIVPNFEVSTKKVFQSNLIKIENKRREELNSLFTPLIKISDKFSKFYNDLISLEPIFKDKLKLSGSGGSLFIENPTKKEVAFLEKEKAQKFRVFLVEGLKYYHFKEDWGVAKW